MQNTGAAYFAEEDNPKPGLIGQQWGVVHLGYCAELRSFRRGWMALPSYDNNVLKNLSTTYLFL